MLIDDYGSVVEELQQTEQYRQHVLSDATDLLAEMGTRAFLSEIRKRLTDSVEADNIDAIIGEGW